MQFVISRNSLVQTWWTLYRRNSDFTDNFKKKLLKKFIYLKINFIWAFSGPVTFCAVSSLFIFINLWLRFSMRKKDWLYIAFKKNSKFLKSNVFVTNIRKLVQLNTYTIKFLTSSKDQFLLYSKEIGLIKKKV